jgi:hypothetical protein
MNNERCESLGLHNENNQGACIFRTQHAGMCQPGLYCSRAPRCMIDERTLSSLTISSTLYRDIDDMAVYLVYCGLEKEYTKHFHNMCLSSVLSIATCSEAQHNNVVHAQLLNQLCDFGIKEGHAMKMIAYASLFWREAGEHGAKGQVRRIHQVAYKTMSVVYEDVLDQSGTSIDDPILLD